MPRDLLYNTERGYNTPLRYKKKDWTGEQHSFPVHTSGHQCLVCLRIYGGLVTCRVIKTGQNI